MNILKELANRIQALKNCKESNNLTWIENHSKVIDKIVKLFPHGSGINYDYYLDIDKCNDSKIVFSNSFDTMTDTGFYDKIINFTVTVKPNFIYDFTVDIKGNFGKYQDIKTYLAELYEIFFSETDLPVEFFI